MRRIGLIDVDGHNFPNLAIMKLAGWHRREGDAVEWYTPFDRYDRVYASKVFTFTADYCEPINNADEVVKGGTGYSLRTILPADVEFCTPDYTIYNLPRDTAYGFLTRGCPNRCAWCVVPRKDGNIRRNMDVDEIAEGGRRTKLVLLDNNILAAGDHAAGQLEKIIDRGYRVDFNQAMDARRVYDDTAQLLARVKWMRYVRFGCDTMQQVCECERAIQLMERHGYRGQYMLYTMLHGDIRECLDRLTYFKGAYGGRVVCHAQPFLDFSGKTTTPQWQRDMARWCNHHALYKSTTFNDYEPRKGFKCSKYFDL